MSASFLATTAREASHSMSCKWIQDAFLVKVPAILGQVPEEVIDYGREQKVPEVEGESCNTAESEKGVDPK